MSKTKKAVIVGSVLIGIGVILGFISIAASGFEVPRGSVDLTSMKALHAEKKTVQITDSFDKIEIAGADCMDIMICKSETGKNYVEYYDTDDWTSHVEVTDQVLKFTTEDQGKHMAVISLGFGKDTMTRIYLADEEYQKIAVQTSSGDVTIRDVNIADVEITASSGDVDVSDCDAEAFDITTASGDVDMSGCDAEAFDIKTASGDVDMKLATDRAYRFETKTNSGEVEVPQGDEASPYHCRIVTGSGDIDVEQR